MRRITLESVIPGLSRKVGDCTREELLATAEHQRGIEQLHADALARAARTGVAAPEEAYETAWRTHCRAHFYAAVAADLPDGEPARAHRTKEEVERLWQAACASAGEAPWQGHATVTREREARRTRERRAEAKADARAAARGEPVVRKGRGGRDRTSPADEGRPRRAAGPGEGAGTRDGRPPRRPRGDAPFAGGDDRPHGARTERGPRTERRFERGADRPAAADDRPPRGPRGTPSRFAAETTGEPRAARRPRTEWGSDAPEAGGARSPRGPEGGRRFAGTADGPRETGGRSGPRAPRPYRTDEPEGRPARRPAPGRGFEAGGTAGRDAPGGRQDGAPRGARPSGGRPSGDRPGGDRPMGGRPTGDRPAGDRPMGDRPSGGRPGGGRPAGGRTGGGRTGGGRAGGGRTGGRG